MPEREPRDRQRKGAEGEKRESKHRMLTTDKLRTNKQRDAMVTKPVPGPRPRRG